MNCGEYYCNNCTGKRYHYSKENDILVMVDSIFFDSEHMFSSLKFGINILDEEFIVYSTKPNYYLTYVLDDLYFLGFIDKDNYEKAKVYKNGHFSKPFFDAFNKYLKHYSRKTNKPVKPLRYSNDIEIFLSNAVYEHWIALHKQKEDNMETDVDNTVQHIGWDNYFMGICELVKLRSKDPHTKVGACIVKNNRILSTGYNGFPNNLSDEDYPWTKGNEDPTKNKYYYVVHAELNAILNARVAIEGATLYVNKFPCNECAKAIIQSGIKKVIYSDDKNNDELFRDHLVSTVFKMFKDAGVEVENYKSKNISINITI